MNALRKFREALRLSRNDLGHAVDVSPQTIEKYEAEPPERLVQRLAEFAISQNRPDLAEELLAEPPRTTPPAEQSVACPHCRNAVHLFPYQARGPNGELETRLMAAAVLPEGSHPSATPISNPPMGDVSNAKFLENILRNFHVPLSLIAEVESWLRLVARAVTVANPDWREMLGNIKRQLEQVAKLSDREKHGNRSDLQGSGNRPRTVESGGHGTGDSGATGPRDETTGGRGKKAG